MEESYRPGCWTCIGPELLSKSVRQYTSEGRAGDLSLVPMARSGNSLLSPLSALSNINISESSQSTGRGQIRSSTPRCPSASRSGEKYSSSQAPSTSVEPSEPILVGNYLTTLSTALTLSWHRDIARWLTTPSNISSLSSATNKPPLLYCVLPSVLDFLVTVKFLSSKF